MKKIPVVICIDVEPEDRETGRGSVSDWAGVDETIEFFSALRPRLELATGAPARFCWFFRMDPQVEHTYGVTSWGVERYRAHIRKLEAAGDELGLHTHAWRWDATTQRWVIDHGDQAWVEHCVRTSIDTYRKVFGRACRSFRFGDRWMNNDTIALLESSGIEFDLTLEPGRHVSPDLEEVHTGTLPDYRDVPTWPYRPAQHEFRRRGRRSARDLWVIPLSTGRFWPSRFAPLERGARALGINLHRRHETTPLFLNLERPRFELMVNSLLAVWTKPFLAPVLRSDAAGKVKCKANMRDNVEFLLTHPLASRFRFVRPHEAIELLS
jgi:peptidoglycan/xylan/chitin deacetylase (PgdA/CDA1 family)